MSKQPLISVCIPTYSRALYIGRCIESILGYPGDIEIIVLDNCSTDNTLEIARKYTDPRLRVLSNESNIGALKNIRKVLDYAQGEYCLFLTDDDMLVAGGLQLISDFINANRPDVFTSDLFVHLEKSRASSISSAISSTKMATEMSVKEKALIFIRSHILSGVCFRKAALDFSFYNQHEEVWYPSTLICGFLHERMGYLAQPAIIHIWENELFWGPNASSNQLYDSYIDIIFFLRSHLGEELFKEICIRSAYNDKKIDARFKSVLDPKEIRKIQKKLYREQTGTLLKQKIRKAVQYITS